MVQTKARAVGRVWSRDYQIFQDGSIFLVMELRYWFIALLFTLALKQSIGTTQQWPIWEENLLLKNRPLAAT